MIGQQYYTRYRGGLFVNHDGYDSIAKSKELKLEFIKKNIHPFCNYDVPSELQKSGEADEYKYPPNFLISPIATGELLVGQAVFKSKDFTGLRSTFFMHNYVLGVEEKKAYIRQPERLFGISSFKTSYDSDLGNELPTPSSIPYNEEEILFKDRDKLLRDLGISEELFKKLLYAIYMAVNSKKKVYICLNVPIEELGQYAKALLYQLYKRLPWRLLEELGVSTYSGSMEAKKNIHVLFIDKTSLRYDSKTEKEFIFDFVNQKFLNVDVDVNKETYLSTALYYADNKIAWQHFNELAEAILVGLGEGEAKSLNFYNHIVILFEMDLYYKGSRHYALEEPRRRSQLLKKLLGYIQLKVAEPTRKTLEAIMDYAIEMVESAISKDVLLESDEIDAILKFKLHIKKNVEEEKIKFIKLIINNLEKALHLHEDQHIDAVLKQISKEKEIYKSLMEVIYNRLDLKRDIAYKLINKTFAKVSGLEEFIVQMNKLSPLEEIFIRDEYYEQVVMATFERCMTRAADKVKLLFRVQEWCQGKEKDLYKKLLKCCETYFLEEINLQTIESEEVLCSLYFKNEYTNKNYEIIELYKKLRGNPYFLENNKTKLSIPVQQLIRKYYKKKVTKEQFNMIVYGFLHRVQTKYGYEELVLDVQAAIGYLYLIDVNTMLDFIIWSKGKETYINAETFDADIVRFFKLLKEQGLKLPKEVLKRKLEEEPKTRRLYEKIKVSQQSPFMRSVLKNKKVIGIGGFIVIIMGISGGYVASMLMKKPVAIEAIKSNYRYKSYINQAVDHHFLVLLEEKKKAEENQPEGIEDNNSSEATATTPETDKKVE